MRAPHEYLTIPRQSVTTAEEAPDLCEAPKVLQKGRRGGRGETLLDT